MAYPILKPNSSWFTPTVSTIKRATITTINIVDSYTPSTTPTDYWDASVAQDGSIMCYVEETVLTIAGNGSGKIMANEDSNYVFGGLSTTKDYFTSVTAINGLTLLDTSNATTMTFMLQRLSKIETLDLSNFNTINVTNMRGMLQLCESMTNLIFGENFKTNNVTNMTYMFNKCYSLTTIDLDNWDTSNLTDASYMFSYCTGLTELDVSKWNISKLQNASFMFNSCEKLTALDVLSWNTSSVTNFDSMFQNCKAITNLDVSKWNTSKVTNMGFMFYSCDALTELPIDNWNVSNVENFDHMFAHSSHLKLNVSKWKVTNKGKYFGAMFHSNANTYLDLSGFDVSGAVSLFSMFELNKQLERIDGLDKWNTSNCNNFHQMFLNCYNLKELNLSSWDTGNADNSTPCRSDESMSTLSKCTLEMFKNCYRLEKITFGANFTFAGDGTAASSYYGTLPTPSATYINNADGNWYTIDGIAYTPSDIPNLIANTYYASMDIVDDAICWERDNKKYMHLSAMRKYHDMHNEEIDIKLDMLKESISEYEELTAEDIQSLFI